MIDRVYLIGAGASVPYGLPALNSLSWELAQSLTPAEREVFLTAVRECFGRELSVDNASLNFETLLTNLDPLALRYLEGSGVGWPQAPRRRAAEIALNGLRRFIQAKCEAVATRQGPFDRLVASLDHRAVTISFNWDFLLELAILRAGRAYCYLPPCRDENSLVLLKPHGSVNWFALLDREMLQIREGSNLLPIGESLRNYLCYVPDPLNPIDFTACSEMVRHSLATVPAIVPPISSKILSVGGAARDGYVEHGHTMAMKGIWATALAALAEARQLVVIGYSLPGTDAASIEALKHFVATSTPGNPKTIHLVEPRFAEVAAWFRAILGMTPTLASPDFAQFDPSMV